MLQGGALSVLGHRRDRHERSVAGHLQYNKKLNPLPAHSRYHGLDTATFLAPDGRTIVYLRRRFVHRRSAWPCCSSTR